MGTLVKLRLTQAKGMVRNLFAKPLSAIVTLLIIGLYGTMFVPLFLHANEPPISGQAAQIMVLSMVGFGLLLETTTFIQNKKSLFFASDAHYLYTGPFTRRQVLGAYAVDNLSSALMFGLFSLIPVVMGSANGSVSLPFLLLSVVACTLAHCGVLNLNGIFYVRQLSGPKKGNSSSVLLVAFAVILVGVMAAGFAMSGFDVAATMTRLSAGPLLNWVPFFGWARLAMLGALQGDMLAVAIGMALLLAAAVGITLALTAQKGDFYERSMMDAEAFTEYYQKARSGQATDDGGKVHKAKVRFGKGAGAILSKNLLIALKGRDLLRVQDFIVIAVYLGMAYFMGMGYVTFASMLMFWMFMMASASSLVDDLQHHYVYLIPGGALAKLLCTLVVPLAKSALVLLISLVAGGLLMGEAAGSMVTASLVCLPLLLVFMAGNVLSIRLLKSRSNKMVEQMLRMLLAVLALLPGAVLYFVLVYAAGGALAGWAGPAFAAFNLLLSLVVLLACSPMMQGNELNAD